MNRTENAHNHIQNCIRDITEQDLQTGDKRMIASETIKLLNTADQASIEERGVLFLISALRDREEEETIGNKKDNLVVAGIVWKALNDIQRLLISKKLHTYDKLPSIDADGMHRIKTRFKMFIDKFR